mmetsp:Transcript_24210/g.81629  ORF Transcript_24210/g.81629 Transcript_24210/m.81629 type:complete len:444 (-) Transcript_24210:4167-5498(-)
MRVSERHGSRHRSFIPRRRGDARRLPCVRLVQGRFRKGRRRRSVFRDCLKHSKKISGPRPRRRSRLCRSRGRRRCRPPLARAGARGGIPSVKVGSDKVGGVSFIKSDQHHRRRPRCRGRRRRIRVCAVLRSGPLPRRGWGAGGEATGTDHRRAGLVEPNRGGGPARPGLRPGLGACAAARPARRGCGTAVQRAFLELELVASLRLVPPTTRRRALALEARRRHFGGRDPYKVGFSHQWIYLYQDKPCKGLSSSGPAVPLDRARNYGRPRSRRRPRRAAGDGGQGEKRGRRYPRAPRRARIDVSAARRVCLCESRRQFEPRRFARRLPLVPAAQAAVDGVGGIALCGVYPLVSGEKTLRKRNCLQAGPPAARAARFKRLARPRRFIFEAPHGCLAGTVDGLTVDDIAPPEQKGVRFAPHGRWFLLGGRGPRRFASADDFERRSR